MSFRRLIRRLSRRESKKARRGDKISLPTNFEHRVHVIVDKETGQYIGLPTQWASIINTKVSRTPRRSNSSPDLRHHYAEKQNGGLSNTNKHYRNSFQFDQDVTIERLKLELREYKAQSPTEATRYSWLEKAPSSPKENGKLVGNNNIGERLENQSTSTSPIPLSAIRSESTV